MKKLLQYILSLLIIILSIGQKDINLLVQKITEEKYVIKYDSENEEGEEDSESEKDSEEKKEIEEEIEGKRKKQNLKLPTPLLSKIYFFDSINNSFNYYYRVLSNGQTFISLPLYLFHSSLVLYEQKS